MATRSRAASRSPCSRRRRIDALFRADGLLFLSAIVQFGIYLFALGAAGSALALLLLRRISPIAQDELRDQAVLAALAAAACSGAKVVARAWFLTGGSITEAGNPAILSALWSGPLGDATQVRLAGLALILLLYLPWRILRPLAAVGALMVAVSFPLNGHAQSAPGLLLPLYTTHLLVMAFWLGGLRPLHTMPLWDVAEAGAAAEEFGRKALLAVALLILSGAAMLGVLSGGDPGILDTLWGRILILKLGAVALILALAALNKLILTRGLMRGKREAGRRLRRSIRMEVRLMLVVFALTAILTSIASPEG